MQRVLRTLLPLAAALALCAAIAPAAGAACAGEDLPYSAANESQMADAVTCLVNAERTTRGLPALARDARLDAAARAHSADMADNNYFDHDSQDGTKFSKRITDAGYSWIAAGENIAAGQRTARAVMSAWMASTGHCQNILSGAYLDLGVGIASGPGTYGLYWTQDFARSGGSGGASTAASGCPFKSLIPDAATNTAGSCGTGTLVLDSVRRVRGGNLRVAGRVGPAGCAATLYITVKRGSRSLRSTRTVTSQKFSLRLRLPKSPGKVHLTVKLGDDGPTVRRTVKL